MSSHRRAARRSHPLPLVLVVLAAIAGCSAADEPDPAIPSPSGQAAEACRALHSELPKRVYGERRVTLTPESPFTSAWGEPAIELRCGVPRPDVLSPKSDDYDPTANAARVNGVSWLIEQREHGYRFTTTERVAYVEVSVPDAYAPEIGALTDLAAAVRASVAKGEP